MTIEFRICDHIIPLNKILTVTYSHGRGRYDPKTDEITYKSVTFYAGTFGNSQEDLIYERILLIIEHEKERWKTI